MKPGESLKEDLDRMGPAALATRVNGERVDAREYEVNVDREIRWKDIKRDVYHLERMWLAAYRLLYRDGYNGGRPYHANVFHSRILYGERYQELGGRGVGGGTQ